MPVDAVVNSDRNSSFSCLGFAAVLILTVDLTVDRINPFFLEAKEQ